MAIETPKSYVDNFFNYHLQESTRSAQEIIPLILKYINPRSMIDVGCGVGTWLAVWKKMGVSEILGVDGSYVKQEDLLISPSEFIAADLDNGIKMDKTFELLTCLEVAEHIKPENATQFISSICKLSDIILFSAAIPGQEGTLHINEQYPGYWIKEFEKNNFTPFDCIREKIWNNKNISWWYRQNIMFYIKNEAIEKYPLIKAEYKEVLALVHPELFNYKSNKANNFEMSLRSPYTALKHFARKYLKPAQNK